MSEKRHLTNAVTPLSETTQEVIEEKKEQGYKVTIEEPKATDEVARAELIAHGVVGIYIEKTEGQ